MNGEVLWNKIVSELSSKEEEIQTKTGLWFRVSAQGEILVIDNATEHIPSCKLATQRFITKKEFLCVYSYYDSWVNGEKGVRQEVSRKSRNTAYILALISRFSD